MFSLADLLYQLNWLQLASTSVRLSLSNFLHNQSSVGMLTEFRIIFYFTSRSTARVMLVGQDYAL